MSSIAAPGRAPSAILVDFGGVQEQRRWTVLLRAILAIPVMFLVGFVGIGAFFVTIYVWFAALFTGKVPDNSARFLVGYLRRIARLYGYLYFLTDRYPPLDGDPSDYYPVDLVASPGPLNRWAVFFRFWIALPAFVFSSLLTEGMLVFSVVTWLVTLIRGSVPTPIFQANAAAIRYYVRALGYFTLVSSEWPWGSFGDREEYGAGTLTEPPFPVSEELPTPSPSAYPPPPPGAFPLARAQDPSSLSSEPFAVPPPPPDLGASPQPPSVPVEVASSVGIGGLGQAERSSAFPDPVSRRLPPPLSTRVDRRWTVMTSSGAKVLLVVFLVLGIVYQVVVFPHFRFKSHTVATVQALNATTSDMNALNVTLTETNTIAAACAVDTKRFACLSQVLGRQSNAYSSLANSLTSISYPASIQSNGAAMEQDAIKNATVYHELATQASLASLEQLATADHAEILQLQTDFNDHYQSMRQIVLAQL